MLTYSELIDIPDFGDRVRYLQTMNQVGMYTYGGTRSANQAFYHSQLWRDVRRQIILRDNGNDLACSDHPVGGRIYIHHINPITIDDIVQRSDSLVDPENLVCVSFDTHQLIHYASDIPEPYRERHADDMIPWR